MRLQRLTGLEREKIQKEYREILQIIEKLKAILASKDLQMEIIKTELIELRDKFGDARRTEVIMDSREFSVEDMIANEDVIVTMSHNGYIKRTLLSSYRRQNKGGRGSSGTATYDDDFIEFIYQASTHNYLLFFTDKGRVYRIKVYDLPEGSRNSKGRSIANVIGKLPDEKVTAMMPVKEFTDNEYAIMCTLKGTIKKTELSAFSHVRQNGIIAINLEENDKLISVQLTDGTSDIIIGTHEGLACRFREGDVRPMGRTAAGVRGISLAEKDFVISMIVIKRSDAQVMVVSENGYGKRTKYEDFRLTKRGAKGVISMNLTSKTGKVVGLLPAIDSEDLVVMTVNGILIRQSIKHIRTIGRNTQGVRLIRLDEGDKIADITTVNRDDDEETSLLDTDIEMIDENGQEPML
jgi:DNA gyrase subunit A